MAAMHKNEIDALTNKHNVAMTEMAQSYAEKYMRFVEQSTKDAKLEIVMIAVPLGNDDRM